MFAAHVWMDYAWLAETPVLARRGRKVLGRWYRVILVLFGVALLYFGASFILSAIL